MTSEPEGKAPTPEERALAGLLGGLDHLPRIPEPDEDMDERLARLEARADAVKQQKANQQKEADRKLASDREATKGLGTGLSIAYTLIGLPLVGAGLGWLANHQVGVGIGVVLGLILAIVYTVMVLSRDS